MFSLLLGEHTNGMLVPQPCPTLCDPMDCSRSGSSVHGISQARLLECVAILFSRGSSPPRDQIRCILNLKQTFRIFPWMIVSFSILSIYPSQAGASNSVDENHTYLKQELVLSLLKTKTSPMHSGKKKHSGTFRYRFEFPVFLSVTLITSGLFNLPEVCFLLYNGERNAELSFQHCC